MQFWKKIIDDVLGSTPIIGVVGNKKDLYFDEKVKEEEAEKYANSIGAKFLVTSAKDDPKSFSNFVEQLTEEYIGLNKDNNERIESIMINRNPKKNREGCC